MTALYLNRSQSQAVDRLAVEQFEMHGLVLMENAARGATQILAQHLTGSEPVLVVVGPGNNGGDGLAIARHLHILDVPVAVLQIADPERLSADNRSNRAILGHTAVPFAHRTPNQLLAGDASQILDQACRELEQRLPGGSPFGWTIDAVLGTGVQGAARAPMDHVIKKINGWPGQTMAIDVPSGLDCEVGIPDGGVVVKADLTCTFVAQKSAFALTSVPPLLGDVHVVSIGTPPEVLQQVLVETL